MGWDISLLKACFGRILLAMVCQTCWEQWRGKEERSPTGREPGAGQGGSRGHGENAKTQGRKKEPFLPEVEGGGRL